MKSSALADSMPRPGRWLPLVAITALAAGSAYGQGQAVPSLAPMIERVSPAVVNISVSGRIATSSSPLADDPLLRRFFDLPTEPDQPFQNAGSGVIVDAEGGYILTNHHVVENAERITITLLDNRVLQAQVVGSDSASDLAVLKVEADNLAEMHFGESSELRVGDYVVAIGNPFGFAHTVTSGIVSGLGRNRVNPDPNAYEDFIQTDASINPGNSGGALVNLEGDLVGINSAIISRTGGNIGIGFAIPVTIVRNVMEQLIDHGEVSRGLLGVRVSSITADLAAMLGMQDTSGALVTEVTPGSAAEGAGIEIEDVIVSVDEQPVRNSGSLRNLIGLMRPGEEVTVGLIRNGERRSVRATLSSSTLPAAAPAPAPAPGAPALDPVFDGAEFAAQGDGLAVVRVDPGSPADERGLREGDIVTHINRERVRTLADVGRIAADARTVILHVQRGGRSVLILMR